MKWFSSTLPLLVAGVLALPSAGQKPPALQLPQVIPEFQLTGLDGSAIDSQKLPTAKKWLLIYVTPNCATCDKLLRLVQQDKHPELASKMTIIVGGTSPDKVKSLAMSYPALQGASWYADPGATASSALQLPGAPVIFGVRESTLIWQMMGMITPDPEKMMSILISWCQ